MPISIVDVRRPSRARLAVIAVFSLTLTVACDDDGGGGDSPDAAIASDANPVADAMNDAEPLPDAAPDAEPVPGPVFLIHYHRADAIYDGWLAKVDDELVEPTEIDGFGAVYAVPLTDGQAVLDVQLVGGDALEPIEPAEITVAEAPNGAWLFSGAESMRLDAPPAIPGEGQVAVFYLRGDAIYEGWGLHHWGDVARETAWMVPARPGGIDPELGAWWLVDLAEDAEYINVIVHNGDEKDPGPDMGWDLAELGNIVFLLSGSNEISPFPVEVPQFAIDGAHAFWLEPGRIAWDFAADAATLGRDPADIATFELRWAADGSIVVEGADVSGGERVGLTLDGAPGEPSVVDGELAERWPHLEGHPLLAVPEGTDVAELLKGQLVAVARAADGEAVAATGFQIPGVIDAMYAYDGPLGLEFGDEGITARVWAPTARNVALYHFDDELVETQMFEMARSDDGVWSATLPNEVYGTFFQYEVTVFHPVTGAVETTRVTDPYAHSLSIDSRHVHIVDLDDPALKPEAWDAVVKPALEAPEDISIYELHLRDFSARDPSVPQAHRGKYLAFTHTGGPDAEPSAGVGHLTALRDAGLNTLHILPAFDLATVRDDPADRVEITDPFSTLCDKTEAVPAEVCEMHGDAIIADVLAAADPATGDAQAIVGWMRSLDGFNWGYDPYHYTVPEGSYATDAHGGARIVEFRQMIMALASIGLRVALDVVYNHTHAAGPGDKSVLDKLVPGYYHRLSLDSGFVETSTCCPNTATEHVMMERLMIDSLVTWARAYKIDSFRFDLMGHHMKRNMERARDALHALTLEADGVDGPSIYLYGEGWNFGEVRNNRRGEQATQLNLAGTGIGTFNDRLRDAVRGGGPFDSTTDLVANQGFINGLYTDPNALAAEIETFEDDETPVERLRLLADQVRIGMAGNLKSFRIEDRSGRITSGAFVPYLGEPTGYTDDPQEVITYVSKHDNQTLFDINAYKVPAGTDMATRVRIHNLGLSIVTLGQGIPFFHAGVDLLRSKSMERDSYDSGDWFNYVDWSGQTTNWNVGLPREDKDGPNWDVIGEIIADASIAPTAEHIAAAHAHFLEMLRIRYSTPLFRLRTKHEVRVRLDFHNTGPEQIPGLIAMSIADGACAGDDLDPALDGLLVFINTTPEAQAFEWSGGGDFVLHPVLTESADPMVRMAAYDAGTFDIPARTTAVFVLPQADGRPDTVPCNAR